MTIRQAWRAVNRHAAVWVCLALFAAACVAAHLFAVFRIDLCDGQFALMDQMTVRSLALVGFVRGHPWLPCLHALLTAGGVLAMQWRGHPEWAWWLWSAALCSPFAVYVCACAHIGGKLMF